MLFLQSILYNNPSINIFALFSFIALSLCSLAFSDFCSYETVVFLQEKLTIGLKISLPSLYPVSQGIFLEIHCFILLLQISETVGFMSSVAQIIF